MTGERSPTLVDSDSGAPDDGDAWGSVEPQADGRLGLRMGRLAMAVAVLALWDLLGRTGVVSPLLLPSPLEVSEATWKLVRETWFPRHFFTTLVEILGGFALATVIAVPLGIVAASSGLARRWIFPHIIILQVVPKIALAPIFIVWLGPGVNSKVVMAGAIALFPAVVNTMIGLESVDENAVLLMRSLKSSRWQTLRKLSLPSSAPAIVAGLETALTFSFLGVIAAEFISSQAGLGTLLIGFMYEFKIAAAFAVIVVISAMGLVIYFAFVWLMANTLLRRPGLGDVL